MKEFPIFEATLRKLESIPSCDYVLYYLGDRLRKSIATLGQQSSYTRLESVSKWNLGQLTAQFKPFTVIELLKT